MAKTIYSCVLLGNPIATGELTLLVGTSFATAVVRHTVTGSGTGALGDLSEHSGPALHTGKVVDDTLGVAFTVDSAGSGEQVFIALDGAEYTGVVVQAAVLSGTVDRTKSAAATESFLAGVAVGVAIAK